MVYRVREGMDISGRSTFTVETRRTDTGEWQEIKGQLHFTTLNAARTFVKSLKFQAIYHEVD